MPQTHITYPEGPQARAGDVVTYFGERSTVEVVIVDDLIAQWGVEEPGLMLQNANFGRVFVAASGLNEAFVYVSRETRWQSTAIERLPELRETIAKAWNIMSLWIELSLAFDNAYREPRNDDLIARIYSYADWCLAAPRNDDAGHDPSTAVAVGFYEHIPQSKAAREDMPRWFTYDEVAGSRSIFAYHIGEDGFRELLEHMRRNKRRYVPRPAAVP